MGKISKYQVVYRDLNDSYDEDVITLEDVVNHYIDYGWQPYGSLVYDIDKKELCQAMVMYED
jgi:hypothetical protein